MAAAPGGPGQGDARGELNGQAARPAPGDDSPAPWRWQRAFPGERRQLALLRQWLTSLLPDCPARDDVLIVASELAGNAVIHTASGRGGWFTTEITMLGSALRVAVRDQGSPGEPRLINDPDGETGRGLLLVTGVSAQTGITGDQHGRQVWADIKWNGPHDITAHAAPGTGPAAPLPGSPAV